MSQPSHEDVRQLLSELIVPFYLVKRDMRVTQGRRRLENDAEHSWGLALLACALAPQVDTSLDVGKIAQFAVVHDIVELYAGDTTPWGAQQNVMSKKQREAKSLTKIKRKFKAFPWITQTIDEYDSHLSNEARFVWAVDKYINQFMRHLDDGKFYRSIKLTKQKFDQRLALSRQKAHAHKSVGEYYEVLWEEINRSPHQFHGGIQDAPH